MQKQQRTPRGLPLFILCLATLPVHGEEQSPFTRLFDTGVVSAEPLIGEALAKRTGWHLVPEDATNHLFAGDAVLLNDKLTVVLRKRSHGAEVYASVAAGPTFRAALGHVQGLNSAIERVDTLSILENTSGAVAMEVAFRSSGSDRLRFRLTTGEAVLEVRSEKGAGFVDIRSPVRYLVVPDYFGDDLILGSEAYRGCYLPAENFCLGLLDGGDAIVMSVWQASAQDVWLAPASADTAGNPDQGAGKNSPSSRIRCLRGKSIWLAFLESPAIWHAGTMSATSDWKPPFPAKWRCDLVKPNGMAESGDWESTRSDKATGKNPGSLLVYPIDRSVATPLTVTCPTDVMRNTLGVGPCQYILAVEGLAAQGDPTPNSVMNWVEKQFEQQKEKKVADDIRERLAQTTEHVAQARARITRYAAFATQARKLLPDKGASDAFRAMVDDLDRFAAAGLVQAAAPERARQLADQVSALIGQQNALAACRRFGEQLRSMGAVQDGALARCRMAVRRLRQESRTVAATRPQEAESLQKLQRLAEEMLKQK